MDEGYKPPLKKEENNPIKEEILEEEGKKLSRDIARKYIYVRNKEKYPLPFEEYKIYHIDGKLFNDSVNNLYLCTKEQRNALYAEQLRRKKPFESSKEIDLFLQKTGATSPEISKDRRVYEKINEKIPLYWKQREIRQQTRPREDLHPELRKKIIEEIKEKEDDIEEKREESRVYSIPPKRHPELKKRIIEEIKEAEEKQRKGSRRKLNLTEKIVLLIGILAVIGLFLFVFKSYIFHKTTEIQGQPFNLSNSKLQNTSEQFFNYEIRTDRYFIIVINNEDKSFNLEIGYNRYSQALSINENTSIEAFIPAKGDVLLKDPGFSRDLGCVEKDCEVSIISSKII